MNHRVIIVGGGFGGLYATQSLKRAPVDVTLLDRRNFHLFQPLLYQVATGGLSPANIASPLRSILSRQRNTRVLMGDVADFDANAREVILRDGTRFGYDTLIVASGSKHHYFGNDQWEQFAPGLKTIEDATEIRRRILLAFEAAEREAVDGADPATIHKLMTFVVVGGGPTGVELAGTLAEIARSTLSENFRAINPADAKILLLEGADRVLPPYVPKLSYKAQQSLERLGVTVRTSALVKNVTADGVLVNFKGSGTDAHEEFIPSSTILWGAGVKASSLGAKLAAATGAQTDRIGRLIVQRDLTLPDHPEIFVIGDLANYSHQDDGKPLPGVAPVAIQQGHFVAKLIRARLSGSNHKLPEFHYNDRGSMATIGRASAVADIKGIRFSGLLAWLAWLFIHLMYIVEFQNRILILAQWGWNYFTRNRAARLITGAEPNLLTGTPSANTKTATVEAVTVPAAETANAR